MMAALPPFLYYTSITVDDAAALGFAEDDMGEFDWTEDLDAIDAALVSLGVEPRRLGHGPDLLRDLVSLKPPLLWNMNSGLLGRTREAQVPAVCEMLGIPLIGSGAWTAFLTQDKTLTVDWLRREDLGLSFPESLTISETTSHSRLATLAYPGCYIVKPNNEDSSRGITEPKTYSSPDALQDVVSAVLREWGPVRIERYVEGFDISANLACLPDGRLIALAPLVIESETGIYTGAMKSYLLGAPKKSIEPLHKRDSNLVEPVKRIALSLGAALRFRHYARFDLRLDPVARRLYFLEANLCPSFDPHDDYVLAAEHSGISFQTLLAHIIQAAAQDAANEAQLLEAPSRIRSHVRRRTVSR